MIFFFFFAGLHIYAAEFELAENDGIKSIPSKLISLPPNSFMYPSGNPVFLLNDTTNTISFIEKVEVLAGSQFTTDLRVDQILLNGLDVIDYVKSLASDELTYNPFGGSSGSMKFYLRYYKSDPSILNGALPPGEYEFKIKATTGLKAKPNSTQTSTKTTKIIVDELNKK